MDNAITQPAAAFVHRSRYDQLRTLLSVAWIMVAGLSVSIAILATAGDNSVSPVAPSEGAPLVIPHK